MVKRLVAAALLLAAPTLAAHGPLAAPLQPDEIVKAAPNSDWQAVDPANTIYMDLPTGRVIIVLAPGFAPNTATHIRQLAHDHYFDGHGAIIRVQDNYVVQWSRDPEPAGTSKGWAEYDRAVAPSFKPLPDVDGYAPQAGFDSGFAAASDGKREWLVHCYGVVGVGRDLKPDSGDGSELYAVNGQAPRHLDRNITVVGRVVEGMELLSSLPRGSAVMGFYDKGQKHMPILGFHLASEVSPAGRVPLEALKTDSKSFTAYVAARRNRTGPFFVRPAGHVDVCNVLLPVRPLKP
jgi:peptidylprolyl isomerase